MDIDDLKSPALYFGTTTGQLWMGRDGGEEWELPVRLAAADPLRESRGGVSRITAAPAAAPPPPAEPALRARRRMPSGAKGTCCPRQSVANFEE